VTKRVGEVVPELLEQYGVEYVFGIPGNHTLELYRGLHGSNISHVTTRHEQGAAFMADGFARATGKPGVCFLISGPGLLNAATAIAQALADSIPMLIISAVADRASQGKRLGQLHELPDQQATAASFCRLSLQVDEPEELAVHLQSAFDLFAHQRPGPVHIQIPLDLMGMAYSGPLPGGAGAGKIAADATDRADSAAAAAIDHADIKRLADHLNAAQRPLCVFGGGAVSSADAWRPIVEALDAPVLTTVNAKGVIPAAHELAIGSSPSLANGRAALKDADVVLAVGTEFSETDYDLLMDEPLQIDGELLRIDIDPDQLERNLRPALGVCGEAGLVAKQLLPALKPASKNGAARAARYRKAALSAPHYHEDFARFFQVIQSASPDVCLVGDSTRPTYYATWQHECQRPRRYFHSVSGFGTLGYAIPAAIGAAVGLQEGVVALIGDGGAQFSLTEFATAVDLALPVVFIIWQNAGYEEIANSLQGRGVDVSSTLISSPDFAKLAAAYQLEVATPENLQQLQATLRVALHRQGPSMVIVEQDKFVKSPSGQWYD